MKPTAILSRYRRPRRGGLRISLMLLAPLCFLGLSACALSPPADAVDSVARSIGFGQVRDSMTGRAYFVACNPCATHTPKTALNVATRPVANDLPGASGSAGNAVGSSGIQSIVRASAADSGSRQ